ncbi:MAG: RHS repeat protein [Pyrinomonadaceae bacterium]|nr:RHS repeat protein [Pyrinomonadaceae bacterium]
MKKIDCLLGSSNQVPNQTATYKYDDISRLTSAVNASGTVSFGYDNRNRLKSETDVFGHLIENVYDAAGRRTQLKLDGSVHASFAYDDANRLTGLTDESSQSFTFGYDNRGMGSILRFCGSCSISEDGYFARNLL